MIRVNLPPAPSNYESDVRIPGQAFLTTNPSPTRNDWHNHNDWRHIHTYLYTQLNGICSYCATYTPRRQTPGLDHTSIDHYIPKSIPPHLQAYEWDNFRLCRARLNNLKGDYQDVVDPCVIQNGWFRINFITFVLSPDPEHCPDTQKQAVLDTIARLELNTDDAYVNERARAIYSYADGKLLLADLARFYPFIAAQMASQNFDVDHLPRFEAVLANPRLRAVLVNQGLIV